MENAPGKENMFPRLYAGSGRVPEDTARRVVFASWALLEPTEGHTDAPAAAAVREELMRCVARGEPPVLCLYAGEDPAWFAAKGGWLAEDNLRCFLRYAGRAARAFGHLTDEYITLFEPNELVWKKSANRNLNLRFKMLSHMACAHVRAVKLVRDTRAQRQLPETRIGFVLRMYPAIDLRRGLLRGTTPRPPRRMKYCRCSPWRGAIFSRRCAIRSAFGPEAGRISSPFPAAGTKRSGATAAMPPPRLPKRRSGRS